MRYLFLIIIFFVSVFANDYKKVLFISSYDLSFPTVKKQIQGIKEVLDEHSYQLDIEFMDTKRFNPKIVEPLFYKTLTMKKELINGYDAILVGDDNALRFIEKYQNKLFYQKPIVFFAINNVLFAKKMAENKYITGVIEKASIKETIDLINSFHPNESKMITIIDNTVTAKSIIESFDRKILGKMEFLNVSDYSFNDFEKKLKSISTNRPILFISALIDKNGHIKEFYPSLDFIKEFTNSPIYHFYEHGIGDGILGGKVVVFKEQGKKAAIFIKKIFQGKSIDKIKASSTQNRYLFDYEELKKFNLLEKVPRNSIILNKPSSFLDQPIVNILLEIIVLFVFILLWVGYLLYKLYKKSKELKKTTMEQSSLLSLFDIGDTVLFKWNNDENWSISYISSNIENLLGFTKEEFLNEKKNYFSCIHKDDIKTVKKEIRKSEINENSFFRHTPYRLITKDKTIKWVIDYTVLIKDENEKTKASHFLCYLLDITKEKNIQDTLKKLVDSQNNIICLSDGKRLSYANKKFYDFFKCTTIEEFQDRYVSLSGLFISNDRFFHLGKINKGEFWMKKIQDFPENERVVAFPDADLNICAFSVNSNKFDEDLYLVSFTDISETIIEQIKLEKKTIHDKLTGAYNREFFDSKYKSLINECESSNKQLALAILDIDHFKLVNDTYGHDIGDEVLKEFVERIKKFTRNDDVFIRWGGEEFLLVLKVKSKEDLKKALEHLRKVIEMEEFKVVGQKTCSIGGTIYKEGESIETTIKRADEGVYDAKAAGRNLVVVKKT